jgi:hypothetical protein
MGTNLPATARGNSSKQEARFERIDKSPEVAALAKIERAVRDDCRVNPKAYLDEVRVAGSGE